MLRRRSEQFLKSLAGATRAIVATHDNPDPDALASGWALAVLIRERAHLPVRFVAGGAIERAENRCMVELLRPPVELVDAVQGDAQTAVVLTDCQPETLSYLQDGASRRIAAVVDHHARLPGSPRAHFRDIRPRLSAAATIAAQYLREQRVTPGTAMATALLYGIQTDARSSELLLSRADQAALSWLVSRADLKLLARITGAPLHASYYGDLLLALESTFLYQDAALCILPSAHGSEVVGEVADLLIRCEGVERVLCAAAVGQDTVVSVRTSEGGGDAVALVHRTIEGIGHAGGHRHRAGGLIPGPLSGEAVDAEPAAGLRARWLAACGLTCRRGVRLVPRQRILALL